MPEVTFNEPKNSSTSDYLKYVVGLILVLCGIVSVLMARRATISESVADGRNLMLGVQLALGLAYLLSFSTKAAKPLAFFRGVKQFGITGPRGSVFVGSAVIACEGFLALTHLTGYLGGAGAIVGSFLLSIFLVATGIASRKIEPVTCFCFGSTETISFTTIARLVTVLAAQVTLAIAGQANVLNGTLSHALSLKESIVGLSYASMLLIGGIAVFSLLDLRSLSVVADAEDR